MADIIRMVSFSRYIHIGNIKFWAEFIYPFRYKRKVYCFRLDEIQTKQINSICFILKIIAEIYIMVVVLYVQEIKIDAIRVKVREILRETCPRRINRQPSENSRRQFRLNNVYYICNIRQEIA